MIRLSLLGAVELSDARGAALTPVVAQPKRLALLAYLVLARPRAFHRRDELLPLFWPELDDARARAALRKSLHFLRRALGPGALPGRGAEEVGVDPRSIWCDAVAFEEALAAGRPLEALALYRGDLLPGFFVDHAPELDRWLDAERHRLRQLAGEAARDAAREVARSDVDAAIPLFRRALALSEDEVALRELLEMLHRQQGAAAALREYDRYRAALRAELEMEPARETQAVVERIRRSAEPPSIRESPVAESTRAPVAPVTGEPLPADTGAVPASVESGPAAAPPDGASRPRPGGRARVRRRPVLAAVTLVLVAAVGLALARALAAPAGPVIAVGRITDHTGDSTLAPAVPDLLTTNLERVPGLRVVATTRIMELLAQEGALADPSAGAIAAAARRAGATQLVEGALYRLPDRRLRLDLRRVSLADGTVLETRSAVADDAFAVVDRATAEVLAGIGLQPARLWVADVTTHSLVAYRLYQRGLRAYYGGNRPSARSLFAAALDEDSTFAMAAYFSAVASSTDADRAMRDIDRAARLVEHVSERERLLILGTRAFWRDEPARLAYAESLATRYPDDPAGALLHGQALLWAGRFLEALVPLGRAVAADSMALARNLVPCRACDAMGAMVDAYLMADSMAAAERTARRLYAARPQSPAAMLPLITVLELQGRAEEWRRLRSQAADAGLDPEMMPIATALMRIRGGEFREADALLRGVMESGPPRLRREAQWYLVLSLRYQGRLREALAVARAMATHPGSGRGPSDSAVDLLPEAIVRAEMGEHLEAARQFERVARLFRRTGAPASEARHAAWHLTHAAGALARAGRLDALAVLADSIRRLGARSAYGRDARLHHHVTGLRQAALGRTDSAIASFRAAIFSPTAGYTRTNVELGRLLLRAGRPVEAAAILAPVLHGGLEASALYATHTEVHALLGEALLAAGKQAQAREHLEWALAALAHADPAYDAQRARLGRLRSRAEAAVARR